MLWRILLGMVALCCGFVYTSKLEIVDLKMRDTITTPSHTSPCNKKAFDTCQGRFQKHVQAVSADNHATDKQDLWCEVLSAHRSCMEEVMDVCRSSYPTLSSKITKYLQQVVHKGCTHEGTPIDKTCVDKQKEEGETLQGEKTLYDIANDCLKHNSKLDPQLQTLVDLLNNLTRSIHHLYKRLPDQ